MHCEIRSIVFTAALGISVALLAGCGFLEDAVETTKDTVKKQTTTQKKNSTAANNPAPSPSGPVEKYLKVVVGEQTVNLDTCFIRLIPSMGGRPSVLKITSYPTPNAESFPSIFMQAHTTGDSIQQIIGKPLQARVYLTTAADKEVWYTPEDQPANITIRNADGAGRVIGTIIDGVLVNTATTAQVPISGGFDGSLQ